MEFFDDYEKKFEIISMWGVLEGQRMNHMRREGYHNSLMCVKAKQNEGNLNPLRIAIKPHDDVQVEEQEEDFKIAKPSEEDIVERDWKLEQIHRHITEELKKKGTETLV